MGSIITFLIILSVLVLVHELGHFLTARKFGIKVEEFGLGYPPRLWGKKKGETTYSLNVLLFGGFVRLLGEDSAEQVKDETEMDRAFFKQKKGIRLAVLMAGVVMNFLLGVVLFGAIYTKVGIPEQVDYLVVTGLVKDGPAEQAGLKLEDKIVGVGGGEFGGEEGMEAVEGVEFTDKDKLITDFVEYVKAHQGEELKLEMGDGRTVLVTPRLEEETPEGEGSLGVVISSVDTVLYPVWQRPFRGIWIGLKEALAWGKEIVAGLGGMVFRLFQGEVPEDVAGPVGIYQISQGVVKEGWLATLQFVAILSINLSILNLLPIPALDGGRLMFIAVESITRKRLKPEAEQLVHLVGIVLILGLMVAVTIGDVKRLLG